MDDGDFFHSTSEQIFIYLFILKKFISVQDIHTSIKSITSINSVT